MTSQYHRERIFRWIIFLPLFCLTILKVINNQVRALLGLQTTANLMLNIQALCRKYAIEPDGVIHIGAHKGLEISLYQKMGFKHILFIEANPAVFEQLQANIKGMPNVVAVNYAIADSNGTATLYVTSQSQSSSLLPLKEHQQIYPFITESCQITVQSRTLDKLFAEQQLEPSNFNFISIDIQGAELMAFKGASEILKHIEAINTEVSYRELYEGCAIIDQIDEFLANKNFERLATTTPFHPSWGDAFYVRKKT